MRQGQQNRRGRGRHNNGGGGHNFNNNNNNNNNRKGQNPLARSYESNGPDVKIRGNPAHIAEKYMTLARDAQSSGDSVLAESYLQHAEHYNRIIMAYREQQQQSGEGQYRQRPPHGEGADGNVEAGEDDGEEIGGAKVTIRGQEPQPGMFDSPQPRFSDRGGDQPPREDRGPREDRQQRNFDDRQQRRHDGNRDRDRDGNRDRDGGRRERYGDSQRNFGGNRDDRPERRERYDRFQNQERGQGERGYQERPQHDRAAQERPSQERGGMERHVPEQPAQRVIAEAPVAAALDEAPPVAVAREPREASPPRRRAAPAADRFVEGSEDQPEFLRRPVRRPRREAPPAEASDTPKDGGADD